MKSLLFDLLKRLAFTIPVIFAVVTLVFFLIHLVPGDPVSLLLGPNATVEQYKQLQHELKLDEPLMTQYVDYWKGMFHGDLGRNPITNQSVAERIAERYPATIELALAALFVAILISIPLGVTSAVNHGKWIDSVSSVVALLGISLPNFALGPLMILFFAVTLRLLPVSGRGGGGDALSDDQLGRAALPVVRRRSPQAGARRLETGHPGKPRGSQPGALRRRADRRPVSQGCVVAAQPDQGLPGPRPARVGQREPLDRAEAAQEGGPDQHEAGAALALGPLHPAERVLPARL